MKQQHEQRYTSSPYRFSDDTFDKAYEEIIIYQANTLHSGTQNNTQNIYNAADAEIEMPLWAKNIDIISAEYESFLETILEVVHSANEGVSAVAGLIENIKPLARMSAALKAPLKKMRVGLTPMLECLAPMNVWSQRTLVLLNR